MPPLVTTKENDAALSLQDSQAFLEQLDAAASLNGLAAVYYIEGQFEKAELLLNRALAIHEKALGGAEHPDLARNFNNLALLYNAKRQYTKAESLYERALAILNKTLGAEHTDVAKCLDNYAALLKKTRRTEDAGPLESRARAIRAKHSAGIRKAHGLSDDSDLLRTVWPLD